MNKSALFGSRASFIVAIATFGAFIAITGTVFFDLRAGLLQGVCGAVLFALGAFVINTVQEENDEAPAAESEDEATG